jgi:hypothetical protein
MRAIAALIVGIIAAAVTACGGGGEDNYNTRPSDNRPAEQTDTADLIVGRWISFEGASFFEDGTGFRHEAGFSDCGYERGCADASCGCVSNPEFTWSADGDYMTINGWSEPYSAGNETLTVGDREYVRASPAPSLNCRISGTWFCGFFYEEGFIYTDFFEDGTGKWSTDEHSYFGYLEEPFTWRIDNGQLIWSFHDETETLNFSFPFDGSMLILSRLENANNTMSFLRE